VAVVQGGVKVARGVVVVVCGMVVGSAHAEPGTTGARGYQPVADTKSHIGSSRWVTHVEPVSHLDAASVRALVEPLVSHHGELVVHVPGPGVIMTDDVINVDKAVRLLRLLDHPMADDETLALFDSRGVDVAAWSDAIRSVLPRRGDGSQQSIGWSRLVTDRQRGLIVVIANPETLQAIEAIRDELIDAHKLL